MKKKVFLLLVAFYSFASFGQVSESQKMIELAELYHNFMFRNEPGKGVLKNVGLNTPANLQTATQFIIETVTSKNKILTPQYLTRPDDQVLKQIYIIRKVDLNLGKEGHVDNKELVENLSKQTIPVYELVDNYYQMIFVADGNKNQPFNLSKIDFQLNDYQLKDEVEKGIMFLQCMDHCGTVIWGYMNIVKPPNVEEAYKFIKKYPKFNGQAYYQYSALHFADFEMVIIEGKGVQSYKSYYVDKYYELLLTHLVCLAQYAKEEQLNDLMLGSILRDESLYKYTKMEDVLKELFLEAKDE